MEIFFGALVGIAGWFVVRYLLGGFFTVNQNERAVKTSFGRAQRLGPATTADDPELGAALRPDERGRYRWPQVRVIGPGGPYLKMPWERVHKVSISTATVNMAVDPEDRAANAQGSRLDAVTKDQLDTGLTGQIRYRVSEKNLYAYLFGIKKPIVHVLAYFVSVLRQRIASFEAKPIAITPVAVTGEGAVTGGTAGAPAGTAPTVTGGRREGGRGGVGEGPVREVSGVSINDLRKNLRDLNEYMDEECRASAARYGVVFDASLITGIDPPPEVESALAAINTAHNQVSSDVSLAQAGADQKIVLSRRAVEIETLRAEAEVAPLWALATQLSQLVERGPGTLDAYLRNVRLGLYAKAQRIFVGALAPADVPPPTPPELPRREGA